VKAAVESGIDQNFIDTTEKFSESMVASNTQVRNIFTAIMRLKAQEDWSVQKLYMLLPRLSYAAARDTSVEPLKKALSPAISFVAQEPDREKQKAYFNKFCDCCEAIVGFMPRKQQRG
jgi:CRISPR type III-A-associated protein Csm2